MFSGRVATMFKSYRNILKGNVMLKLSLLLFFCILICVSFVTGCINVNTDALAEEFRIIGESIEKTTKIPFRVSENNDQLEQFNEEINALVEHVTPSVVNIAVFVKQEDIYGNEAVSEGVGSGVIYSGDGYIITNNHVAGSAFELIVTLADGMNYNAKLIGTSEETDIAVIKIDAKNLQHADFASIEDQSVGDFVMAIGSPFGIQQTVTTGIISGKNRNIPVASDQLPIVDLIQTDAAINPGNSGGPLINIYGDVIGINTLIFSTSGASAGIGFAIPSDTAINITDQIIKYGEPRIPFIGIKMGFNQTNVPGVYVNEVLPDTPAEKAGLKSGDIITLFEDKEIKTPFDLLTQILRNNCGERIKLKVYRDGEYIDFDLQLEQCP